MYTYNIQDSISQKFPWQSGGLINKYRESWIYITRCLQIWTGFSCFFGGIFLATLASTVSLFMGLTKKEMSFGLLIPGLLEFDAFRLSAVGDFFSSDWVMDEISFSASSLQLIRGLVDVGFHVKCRSKSKMPQSLES